MIATDWGDRIALDPIFMPDAAPDRIAHVIERGIAHAGDLGFEAVKETDIFAGRTSGASS